MLTSTHHHDRVGERGGGSDEHPNSQQGCSGSLLATQDGKERNHGGRTGTIRKGERDLKKAQGEITRAGGKGKGEKQGEEDERKDQGPAASQRFKGRV